MRRGARMARRVGGIAALLLASCGGQSIVPEPSSGGGSGEGGSGGDGDFSPLPFGRPGRSCEEATFECQGESCCERLSVPGGPMRGLLFRGIDPEVDRGNETWIESDVEVEVSPFLLDKYPVTVGRYRRFLRAFAGEYPEVDAGAIPGVPGSGWTESMSARVSRTASELSDLVYERPAKAYGLPPEGGGYENFPLPGTGFEDAMLFCLWEGGRLPTYAEYRRATVGNDVNRSCPWGAVMDLDPCLAANWTLCSQSPRASSALTHRAEDPWFGFTPVGAFPDGVGPFGHLELVGNSVGVWIRDGHWPEEWILRSSDETKPDELDPPRRDPVALVERDPYSIREPDEPLWQVTGGCGWIGIGRYFGAGFRCAYNLGSE